MSPDVDVSKNRFVINISVATASKEENVRLVLEDVSGGGRGVKVQWGGRSSTVGVDGGLQWGVETELGVHLRSWK